ncbi:MAG: hypothetical protein M1823_002035 [Watsoniomyces obsoletus]|nr:MAG: hypothetical protein M1823_002035 [Watsoniomyces obsoletus]
MLFSSTAVLLGAMAVARAQYPNNEAVPKGQPIPGDYTGALRPQIHYSPPQGFMNDPNGMFRDSSGVWHLYYQYNPTDIVAGNQHWGHATSRDLYTWENQPIALFPDATGDGVFSGSCVIDPQNTSGFFPNTTDGVVAIYTYNTVQEQTQRIAYSYDNGYTFTEFEGNPVISIGSTQFRDPKVIWHEPTKKWVMSISYSQEFAVGIFTSPDLKAWEHASNFSYYGLLGLQYEVPALVQIPYRDADTVEQMWIMLLSINPGAPQGGSITQFFPGDFNGTHFTAVDSAARIADFGKDNYAGGPFYGTPEGENLVSIAWASNWQYSQIVPTGEKEKFRSAMSLPRENYLTNMTRTGWTLVSKPYKIETVFDKPLATSDNIANGSLSANYSTAGSGAIYFQINATGIPSANATGTANFTFESSVSGESVRGGFYFGGDVPFWIDRGDVDGFENPFFTDKFSTNNLISNGQWRMEGVIDRSIIEVFLDGGNQSATLTFFPTQRLDMVRLATGDLDTDVQVSAAIWELKSTWAGRDTDGEGSSCGQPVTCP